MRIKHTVVIAILCVAGTASTSAQSVPPPPPPPQTLAPSPQSAVRVTTRVVQVSVIVQDGNGRPVKGLSKDDFILLDQGQRQPITSISEGTRSFTAKVAAGPNHFTNQLAPGTGGAPPLTVIVIDDSSASYVLEYYPDHNNWNGEFREIKVKVNRPGMEVHARRGYYAVVDTASVPQKDAERLAEAIRSPTESTDLAFDVQADGADVSGARQLKVKIALDANQLRFQQQSDRWTDNISEFWAEFDGEGKQVGEISKTIELNHNEDDHKKLLQDGFSYSKTLVLAKDAAEVRLILRDTGNGAIGSVIIPLAGLFPAEPIQP